MGPLSERNGPDFKSALIKIMAKGKKTPKIREVVFLGT